MYSITLKVYCQGQNEVKYQSNPKKTIALTARKLRISKSPSVTNVLIVSII